MRPGIATKATAAGAGNNAAALDVLAPAWCSYVVRPGDTLYGLARRFGTSVWQLASINHIANINLIRSGRILLVPCGGWYPPPPPPPPGCTYRVRAGDTLSQIAVLYHTTTAYLASINHIANPNRIYAGQWLRVPCWH